MSIMLSTIVAEGTAAAVEEKEKKKPAPPAALEPEKACSRNL